MSVTYGTGEKDDPWLLKTTPQTSEFEAWRDDTNDPPALVVQVGKTRLSYQLRAIEDCAEMLRAHGDWMPLGNADEGKPVKDGTVEAWARDARECGRPPNALAEPSIKWFCLYMQFWSSPPRGAGVGGAGGCVQELPRPGATAR